MSYYQTCPECGAHLDPGESCDCEGEEGESAMTLEEIESMELTDEFIEQVKEREGMAACLALLAFREARIRLDENGGNREAAKAQTAVWYQEYKVVYGSAKDEIHLLLKAIDVLADYRAKKRPAPSTTKARR